jgi:hypothetical protein
MCSEDDGDDHVVADGRDDGIPPADINEQAATRDDGTVQKQVHFALAVAEIKPSTPELDSTDNDAGADSIEQDELPSAADKPRPRATTLALTDQHHVAPAPPPRASPGAIDFSRAPRAPAYISKGSATVSIVWNVSGDARILGSVTTGAFPTTTFSAAAGFNTRRGVGIAELFDYKMPFAQASADGSIIPTFEIFKALLANVRLNNDGLYGALTANESPFHNMQWAFSSLDKDGRLFQHFVLVVVSNRSAIELVQGFNAYMLSKQDKIIVQDTWQAPCWLSASMITQLPDSADIEWLKAAPQLLAWTASGANAHGALTCLVLPAYVLTATWFTESSAGSGDEVKGIAMPNLPDGTAAATVTKPPGQRNQPPSQHTNALSSAAPAPSSASRSRTAIDMSTPGALINMQTLLAEEIKDLLDGCDLTAKTVGHALVATKIACKLVSNLRRGNVNHDPAVRSAVGGALKQFETRVFLAQHRSLRGDSAPKDTLESAIREALKRIAIARAGAPAASSVLSSLAADAGGVRTATDMRMAYDYVVHVVKHMLVAPEIISIVGLQGCGKSLVCSLIETMPSIKAITGKVIKEKEDIFRHQLKNYIELTGDMAADKGELQAAAKLVQVKVLGATMREPKRDDLAITERSYLCSLAFSLVLYSQGHLTTKAFAYICDQVLDVGFLPAAIWFMDISARQSQLRVQHRSAALPQRSHESTTPLEYFEALVHTHRLVFTMPALTDRITVWRETLPSLPLGAPITREGPIGTALVDTWLPRFHELHAAHALTTRITDTEEDATGEKHHGEGGATTALDALAS